MAAILRFNDLCFSFDGYGSVLNKQFIFTKDNINSG